MEQQLEYCRADLELKTVNVPQRIISGYACIHQTPDRVHDIIDPSASAKAVARLGRPSAVAVFVGHNTQSLPVGIPQVIQATPQGLYTETYILKGSAGDNLLAVARDLLDHGQSLGMSIGYKTKDSRHESIGTTGSGKTRRVRRLLDYELKEFSYAAQQAIAHPEALVAQVKTALAAAVAPEAEALRGGSSEWASKTHVPDGDAARARRRAEAAATVRRCDLEAETEQAERRLAQARAAELRAECEQLDRYVGEQQRWLVDEQIREREERERQQQELMQQLRDVANTPIPRSMQDCEQFLQQLERESAQREAARQDQLWKETDAALTRRTYDWTFRRSWDARHPGGPDRCDCDGCRAWRREPPR
jgi:hypothetical protein